MRLGIFTLTSTILLLSGCEQMGIIGTPNDGGADAGEASADAGPSGRIDAGPVADAGAPSLDAGSSSDAGSAPDLSRVQLVRATVSQRPAGALYDDSVMHVWVDLYDAPWRALTPTVVDTSGPCTAYPFLDASDREPSTEIPLPAGVAEVEVGAGTGFVPLMADPASTYEISPSPPVGTVVTFRVDLGARGIHEMSGEIRTIDIDQPPMTLSGMPAPRGPHLWGMTVDRGRDVTVQWTPDTRPGEVTLISNRYRVMDGDGHSVRCALTDAVGTVTLPSTWLSNYIELRTMGGEELNSLHLYYSEEERRSPAAGLTLELASTSTSRVPGVFLR